MNTTSQVRITKTNYFWPNEEEYNTFMRISLIIRFIKSLGLSEKMHSIPIEAIHALPPSQGVMSNERKTVDETGPFEPLEKDASPNFSIDDPNMNSLTNSPPENTFVDTEKDVEKESSDKFEIAKNGYVRPSYLNSEVIEDLNLSDRHNNVDVSVDSKMVELLFVCFRCSSFPLNISEGCSSDE